jgi:zinc transporter ZupT
MQFGKIQGIALLALGFILIAIQAMVALAPSHNAAEPTEAATKTVEKKTTSFLPGIVGAISLIGGLAILVTARRADEPPPTKAVK